MEPIQLIRGLRESLHKHENWTIALGTMLISYDQEGLQLSDQSAPDRGVKISKVLAQKGITVELGVHESAYLLNSKIVTYALHDLVTPFGPLVLLEEYYHALNTDMLLGVLKKPEQFEASLQKPPFASMPQAAKDYVLRTVTEPFPEIPDDVSMEDYLIQSGKAGYYDVLHLLLELVTKRMASFTYLKMNSGEIPSNFGELTYLQFLSHTASPDNLPGWGFSIGEGGIYSMEALLRQTRDDIRHLERGGAKSELRVPINPDFVKYLTGQ